MNNLVIWVGDEFGDRKSEVDADEDGGVERRDGRQQGRHRLGRPLAKVEDRAKVFPTIKHG